MQECVSNALEHPTDQNQKRGCTHQTQILSEEAQYANRIKKETAFTLILGNPPYSGISSNPQPWITHQIEHYKYVNGIRFNERKHWLNDDYVRFIRYGELLIERSKLGILGYITPHGFLDNPTFRGMSWHLLSTFSHLYILDLHGNARKKQVASLPFAELFCCFQCA